MLRRNTGIDDTNNNPGSIKTGFTAQANFGFEQAQELGAVPGRKRPNFIFPNMQHFRRMFHLDRLRLGHASCEAVKTVAIAVDFFGARGNS